MQPRSSRNAVERTGPDRIKVWVTAAPADGEANAAVCALIAKTLRVPKGAVRIVRGASARDKRVEVAGLDQDEAERRLGRAP